MKKILIWVIAFICTVNVSAQSAKTDAMLFGHVTDKETKKHIPYATIYVKGTTMGTACDATGHFKLAHLPLGKQTIVAQFVGYKSQEIEVVMARGTGTEAYFELEEDVLNLEQVVVTGTRTQHYVKNVPIRTEVVTSQALKNKNAWNVFEALEGVPGIRVENQCQFCNFTMVRMQGLGAEHTQVLINGQPIYSGLASVYGLEQIGTGDVDRIEVVKGAGSALYGSSAVAGAINIITREPMSGSPMVSADIQAGNYGSKNLNLNGSIRNKNVGLNVYAQRLVHGVIDATGEGETREEVRKKDGISDRVESKLSNLGFGLFVYNPFAENDKLILRGKTIHEIRAGGTITDDVFRNPFTEGTENIETNRYEAELTYNLPIGTRSELNFSTAYVNHNRQATNDSFLGDYMDTHDGEKPDLEFMRPYIAKENSVTPSLTFASRLGNHNLLIGAQGYISRLNETGLYVIVDEESQYLGTAYTSVGKKRANEFGAFVQDEWNVTPRLTVVPGIRLDYHSSGESYQSDKKVFDSAFPDTKFEETSINPRLAVKYALSNNITLRANFGTGFRAPYGFSEDLHLCSGSPRVWKSSELKGEKSMSYNLSADYYGNHFQVSANLFRTDLKNKIDFAPANEKVRALGYTYQWENVDDAYVQGIELSVLANVARNLNVGVDATFNQGKYKNQRADWEDTPYAAVSKYIPRFPTTTGNFKVEYSPATWVFTLTGSYQGKMYIDYMKDDEIATKIKETSPYVTFNARVSKSFNHKFRLYTGVNNMFSYIQDEKHLDNAAFIYAPLYGALYYAGVSINIGQ